METDMWRELRNWLDDKDTWPASDHYFRAVADVIKKKMDQIESERYCKLLQEAGY